MKGNHGSAFIPDGLLPKFSDDPKLYRRVYAKLRRELDPVHREHKRAQEKKYRMNKYWNDPVWRRAKLDKCNEINRKRKNGNLNKSA